MQTAANRQEPVQDKRIVMALEALDREFNECFAWWGKLYDRSSGGFYYSLSAARSREFSPDIEATSKAVHVLEWTGVLEEAPKRVRAGIVEYMQKRQDVDTGFFRDPQNAKLYSPNALDRALGMAVGSIRRCGGSPLHPLPLDRLEDNTTAKKHYAHLASPEALRAWLKDLPWETRVWTAGSRIRALSGVFQTLPEPARGDLLKALQAFLRTKQHPNGFYGSQSDNWFSTLSGSYKIVSFLDQNRLPVPRVKETTEAVLNHLDNTKYSGLIVLYNTANLLSVLHRYTEGGFSLETRLHIVGRCTEIMRTMHASDGAFLTRRGRSACKAHGFILGEDVIESNTNATGLAHKTRMLLWTMLTGRSAPHPHPRSVDLINALKGED